MGSFSIFHWAILMAVGWFLFSVFGARRNGTKTYETYVIKEWVASETPNQDGVYVRITGRKGGLISFVLAFVGIDPTVSLLVDRENVRFKEGTWHGFNSCVTPIENLCSGNYGYAKPFWGTVVLLVVALFMLLSDETALRIASLILILGAILYYFLNKTTKLGVTYVDGGWNGFAFKRSIIEGKNIDEISAERIISIIEMIMLGKDKLNAINVDGSARASGGIDGGEQARQKMDALNSPLKYTKILMLFSSSSDFQKGLLS